jgi:hypothetical protein
MASAFDPDAFAASTTSEKSETSFAPVPAGEYTAVIEDVIIRSTDYGPVADVVWSIDDGALKSALGRDKITVKQGVFLDVTNGPDGPKLDMSKGKNIALGRIREALDMNKEGQSFALNMLKGAGPASIRVVQKPAKDSDEIYANVKSVGKAS